MAISPDGKIQVDKVSDAYVVEVQANSVDSHQSASPGYVLTFLRFQNRDPHNITVSGANFLTTRAPLCVVSDCVDLAVKDTKASPNSSAEMTLLGGEINYMDSLATGDYLIVNMLESGTRAIEVQKKAQALQPINNPGDGFMGVFRVQSVHDTLADNGEGVITQAYKVTAYSHSEFNDTIYFNPYLVTQGEKDNDVLFLTSISNQWNQIIGNKLINEVQDIMRLLLQAFLGRGLNQQGKLLREGLVRSENNLYQLPEQLGQLLGHPSAKYAADITNLFMGQQQYSSTNPQLPRRLGLNPDGRQSGTFYFTGQPVRGRSYAKPEYWNQVKVWDIVKGYLNDVVNEMYTCIKPDPVTGSLMPTLVIRQKPFTSDDFTGVDGVTRFLNLPRWRIHPDRMVGPRTLGKDDAARVNFVQIFGRPQSIEPNASIAAQIAEGNYVVDRDDIRRSGLRPYIATSNFDYPASGDSARLTQVPVWAQIIGDWLIGGHNKLSGTLEFAGIQEPIAVGDNAQVSGIVLHIEGVTHRMTGSREGVKNFRTALDLSMGVPSEAYLPQGRYAAMNFPNADAYRKSVFDQQIDTLLPLPGVSDTQDSSDARTDNNGEKTAAIHNNPFSPEAAAPAPDVGVAGQANPEVPVTGVSTQLNPGSTGDEGGGQS